MLPPRMPSRILEKKSQKGELAMAKMTNETYE